MRSFLVLVVLAALPLLVWSGFATIPNRTCPLPFRNDLLTCINQIDGNADGNITVTEIDTFMTAHASCIPAAVRTALTGAHVITLCDTNADGNLTAADWSAPTGCFQLRSRQMALCRACDKCGLFSVILKK
jgi:hypothetical protein